MGAEEYAWDSRLCVLFKPQDGSSTIVSPITNFNFAASTPSDIIDSVDGCNLGYSDLNPRYTFDLEVQAINMAVHRKLLAVAIKGTKFNIVLATLDGQPDSWVLDSVEFTDCKVTNSAHSIDNSNKIPSIKFQAQCLGLNISNNGEVITTDKVGGASGDLT